MNHRGLYAAHRSGTGTNYVFIYVDDNQDRPVTNYAVVYDDTEDTSVVPPLTDIAFLYDGSGFINEDKIINIILSTDSGNNFYAKEGDTVALRFEETEEITELTVNIAGELVVPTKDGSIYTALYVVDSFDSENYITFSIDADSDIFTETSGIGRCSKVMIDMTKPTMILSNTSFNALESFILTVKFSEKVNGFNREGIIITSGTMLSFKANKLDSTEYEMKIKAKGPVVNIQISTGAAVDEAGNESDLFNYNAYAV